MFSVAQLCVYHTIIDFVQGGVFNVAAPFNEVLNVEAGAVSVVVPTVVSKNVSFIYVVSQCIFL